MKIGFTIQRLEMVGPKVGADLRTKALEAMFYAILLITIYISGRFEYRWWAAGFMAGGLALAMYVLGQFLSISYLTRGSHDPFSLALCWYLRLNYALGAVVALIHDVLITVGGFFTPEQRIRSDHRCGAADHYRLLAQRHHHRLRPDS